MKVSRNLRKLVSIPCKSSVFMEADDKASYDIRLGNIDYLDIFDYVSSGSAIDFSSKFGDASKNLVIQRKGPAA